MKTVAKLYLILLLVIYSRCHSEPNQTEAVL